MQLSMLQLIVIYRKRIQTLESCSLPTQLRCTYSPSPYCCRCWGASTGSRTRLRSPGSSPPTPDRWDSRTALAHQTHTPSSGRSTAHPLPPSFWRGRGRLGALDRPEPRLGGGTLSLDTFLRQRPAGAVIVFTSRVYYWIMSACNGRRRKKGFTHSILASAGS